MVCGARSGKLLRRRKGDFVALDGVFGGKIRANTGNFAKNPTEKLFNCLIAASFFVGTPNLATFSVERRKLAIFPLPFEAQTGGDFCSTKVEKSLVPPRRKLPFEEGAGGNKLVNLNGPRFYGQK